MDADWCVLKVGPVYRCSNSAVLTSTAWILAGYPGNKRRASAREGIELKILSESVDIIELYGESYCILFTAARQ